VITAINLWCFSGDKKVRVNGTANAWIAKEAIALAIVKRNRGRWRKRAGRRRSRDNSHGYGYGFD
jgi:hypothetical protein